MKSLLFTNTATIGKLALLALLTVNSAVRAQTSSGGVKWLDPLTYTKPAFYPIALPNEASTGAKYYVDMTAGSGTTCSQSAPCASINAVSGKVGTSGGPAYIYLKGNGYLSLTSSTLAGAPGSEIVVKPWPNDSTPAVMTAQGGCNVNNANTIAGSGTHDVIFDGGPNMLFGFVGSGCTSSQNGYTVVVESNDITLYRVRINANGSGGPALGAGTGSGTSTSNFKFINSELYGATQYYGVYTGGGTGCTAGDTSHTNMSFLNSIFRQIDGRGIQVEPRANSSGMTINGNAFHDIGYDAAGTSSISGAVQVADACGGTTTGVLVSDNLMFNLGGGGVLVFESVGSASAFQVINNTIYDYGGAAPIGLNSYGITCYTDGCPAQVINNIVLSPLNSGLNPLNRLSGFVTSNNLCESGSSCGASALSGTASNALVSTNTNSSSFLFPAGAALQHVALQAGVNIDYLGNVRPSATVDLGAISSASATSTPAPPPPLVPNPPTALIAQ
jgi:hypothetical protein